MRQKTIVGLIMAAGAALMIAVGGWVMALIVLVLICFGDVPLRKGRNEIEVRANDSKKQLIDRCTWILQ